MPDSLSITEFRASVSPVFSGAVRQHRPAKIDRNDESAVLLGLNELITLVQAHEFHPRVYREGAAISLWLPEFSIYGRGASFAEARDDLLEEVRAYVEEYLGNAELYMRAPNRAHHFPHVLRAWIADSIGQLPEVLFAQPAGETAAAPTPAASEQAAEVPA